MSSVPTPSAMPPIQTASAVFIGPSSFHSADPAGDSTDRRGIDGTGIPHGGTANGPTVWAPQPSGGDMHTPRRAHAIAFGAAVSLALVAAACTGGGADKAGGKHQSVPVVLTLAANPG